MAGQSARCRWTRFVSSFDHIDAAIEAADPSVSRVEFRRLRAQIVEMLYAAQDDDDRKAEELCLILDGVMEESLATLQAVPADVVPKVLASSPDLAKAVGALRSHGSERVRGLARDVIREWKASVEGDIVTMTAAITKLDAVLQLPAPSGSRAPRVSGGHNDNAPSNPMKKKEEEEGRKPCPKKAVPLVADVPRVRTAAGASAPRKTRPAPAGISRATTTSDDKQAPVKTSESMPRKERRPATVSTRAPPHITDDDLYPEAKMAPVVAGSGRVKASGVSPMPERPTPVCSVKRGVRTENTVASTEVSNLEKKMEATKRKLHEGYQEAADAKRQRKIQVIEAPKMLEQRQRKMHPIMRERSRARSGNPTAARRSLRPSFH